MGSGFSSKRQIAVCICTADRPDVIGQALESVLAQSRRADEVIVIDQSTGGETEQVVAEMKTHRPDLRYLHVTERGLSRAYNTATANSSAELLAFTDDDCVAPVDWLDRIAGCFEEIPDTGLLYGQVLLPASLEARENVDGFTPSLPISYRRRMSRRDGFRVFGMGANFAILRTVLQDLGGFDEVLGGGGPLQSAQDFDLSYRAFKRGHTILLAPEVVVHHYGFRSHQDWPRVVRSYGIGIGGFYGKHVRLGDIYAARLLSAALIRQGLRASKCTLGRRGAKLEWVMLGHTVLGLWRSFRFSIDRDNMLYHPALAGAT